MKKHHRALLLILSSIAGTLHLANIYAPPEVQENRAEAVLHKTHSGSSLKEENMVLKENNAKLIALVEKYTDLLQQSKKIIAEYKEDAVRHKDDAKLLRTIIQQYQDLMEKSIKIIEKTSHQVPKLMQKEWNEVLDLLTKQQQFKEQIDAAVKAQKKPLLSSLKKK